MIMRSVLMRWHRRIGLLVIGMSLVFAVSGISLNHQALWDPYYIESERYEVAEDLTTSMGEDELNSYLKKRYGIEEDITSSLWDSSHTVTISYPTGISFAVDLKEKRILEKITRKRPIIYDTIQLHLNGLKGSWAYISDTFAIGLIFLSISGVYLALGRLSRMDLAILTTGLLLPILFFLYF
jgi:uncharacterized protein